MVSSRRMVPGSLRQRTRIRPPLAIALLLASGCGSPKDAFIAGRALDPCGGSWPVCNTVVGCPLAAGSYAAGSLPTTVGYLVQTSGPATVAVHIYIDQVTAAGSQTLLTWFETGCSSRFQTQVTGADFVGESQQQGDFVRSQELAGAGDHLIQLQSDATAHYLIKVDVTPK